MAFQSGFKFLRKHDKDLMFLDEGIELFAQCIIIHSFFGRNRDVEDVDGLICDAAKRCDVIILAVDRAWRNYKEYLLT